MSSESLEAFPPELQELIVDALSSLGNNNQRKTALQSCLSVCRTFRRRARIHIFSSVSVFNKEKGQTVQRLALLRQLVEIDDDFYGSLGSYIKHLAIWNTHGEEDSKDFLDNGDLAAIMGKLHSSNHGITSFSLIMDIFHSIVWEELSIDFQRSLRSLCRSRFLKSLEISQLLQLPLTIFNGTYLDHLALHDISSTGEQDAVLRRYRKAHTKNRDVFVEESPPRLLSFETDHTFLFPKAWTLNTNDHNLTIPLSPFTQLKYLSVSLTPGHFEDLYFVTLDIMKTAASSLETVSLNFSGNYKNLPDGDLSSATFRLGQLERMSCLRIFFSTTIVNFSSIGLNAIIYILEYASSPPNLETVEISMSLRDMSGKLFLPSKREWEIFDRVISSFCFSSVRRIILVLRYNVLLPTSQAGSKPRVINPKRYNANVRGNIMRSLPTLSEDTRFKLIIDTHVSTIVSVPPSAPEAS